MVNIPVTGAVKVEYTITGGGTYAIFVDTTTPTKWEIGLKTVDGATDTLQSVCITYTEGVPFASVPTDATTSTQHQATHYLRQLENGTENWWPIDAAFGFAGETKTVCVVTDGVVQGDEVAGPFPKPTIAPVSTGFACPSGWTDATGSNPFLVCVQNGTAGCLGTPLPCPAISGYIATGYMSECGWVVGLPSFYRLCLYFPN